MKRDMELSRAILMKMEELPFDGRFHDLIIEGHSQNEISYHVMLLDQAGLIDAIELSSDGVIDWRPRSLTYAGHEFLDAARSNKVWSDAKSFLLKTTGTLTLEGLKVALPQVIKHITLQH